MLLLNRESGVPEPTPEPVPEPTPEPVPGPVMPEGGWPDGKIPDTGDDPFTR